MELFGLGRADLNRLAGRCEGYDGATGRALVRLGPQRVVKARLENLRLVAELEEQQQTSDPMTKPSTAASTLPTHGLGERRPPTTRPYPPPDPAPAGSTIDPNLANLSETSGEILRNVWEAARGAPQQPQHAPISRDGTSGAPPAAAGAAGSFSHQDAYEAMVALQAQKVRARRGGEMHESGYAPRGGYTPRGGYAPRGEPKPLEQLSLEQVLNQGAGSDLGAIKAVGGYLAAKVRAKVAPKVRVGATVGAKEREGISRPRNRFRLGKGGRKKPKVAEEDNDEAMWPDVALGTQDDAPAAISLELLEAMPVKALLALARERGIQDLAAGCEKRDLVGYIFECLSQEVGEHGQ